MKKKILCTMMSMVMAASLFAGCGTGTGTETSASDNSKTEETGTEAAEQPTSDNPYAAYAGTTISVAAIETGYGSQMWQEVTHHLKKVINKLAKTDYIISTKGRNGGLKLGLKPEEINLGKVLLLTEENLSLVECMNEPEKCPLMKEECKLKGIISKSLNGFLNEMSKYTLQDII